MAKTDVKIVMIECPLCNRKLDMNAFLPTTNMFFKATGRSTICIDCLSKKVDTLDDNLENMDKLCQLLDWPFYPDEWMMIYRNNGRNGLKVYANLINETECYSSVDWKEINNQWKAIIDRGEAPFELPQLQDEEVIKLKDEWSMPNATSEELLFLKRKFDGYKRTQNIGGHNINTVMDVCKLYLIANRMLNEGLSTEESMKTYKGIVDSIDKLSKSAGLTAENSKSGDTFDSIGEFLRFLEKTGWKGGFSTTAQPDIVDFIMRDSQGFLQRLVLGEPGLQDTVEEIREQADREKYTENQIEEDLTFDDWTMPAPLDEDYQDEDAYEEFDPDL